MIRIQSELCHTEEHKTIVRAIAWDGECPLGSALGEGSTTYIAEDNAIKRIFKRIKLGNKLEEYYLELTIEQEIHPNKDTIKNNDGENNNPTVNKDEKNIIFNNGKNVDNFLTTTKEVEGEPEEWSKELTDIDMELSRLKWDRNQENKFIKEKFGFIDRARITNYHDLVQYLNALRDTNQSNINDETPKPKAHLALLEESDSLIKQLKWNTSMAREFLSVNMNVTSRQHLNNEQLEHFNLLLRSKVSNHETM
ncbi:hypothetical protein [Prochlorococcus sp. MIT 1307]|uniref:hypothetical protein n=1 Tax=Prochlorococcus sp. MIT 1307 TaxID=3096219 RepID=UPI002A750592|nr:hypothetical protein [Prochlorococcus sp. MIT 1307]